jgi:segregation and condensation protein B
MELSQIIPHIEALIFASEKPLTALDIVGLINNVFGFMEERISLDQIEASLDGIREKYNSEFYPFEVKESGGGWQFLTKKDFHKTVVQLNGDKFLKRLSNAALETLAIIAYKQPITKGEVEAIRGVNSDYSIQKLLEKELIIISGRNEELPGKPLVYSTSKSFMDYFGINSTDDLPRIKEVLAEQSIQGTLIDEGTNYRVEEEGSEVKETNPPEKNSAIADDAATTLIVADNGELIEQAANTNDEEAYIEEGAGGEADPAESQARPLSENPPLPDDSATNNDSDDTADESEGKE